MRDWLDNYVDDIIVFSDNVDFHISDLRRVLEKLKSTGFILQASKCLLCQHSITHLGFHYLAEGVTPSIDKTKTIAEWPVPKSAKELRSFLGFAKFYRNFVPGFAKISAPLNDLTGKSTASHGQLSTKQLLTPFWQSLMSPPILDYPQKRITLHSLLMRQI